MSHLADCIRITDFFHDPMFQSILSDFFTKLRRKLTELQLIGDHWTLLHCLRLELN